VIVVINHDPFCFLQGSQWEMVHQIDVKSMSIDVPFLTGL